MHFDLTRVGSRARRWAHRRVRDPFVFAVGLTVLVLLVSTFVSCGALRVS